MFIHKNAPQIMELSDRIVNGKRFYTTPENNVYPSVTTILGQKEKPWLNEWKNMLGPKKAVKETKRCSDRGTAVHAMAEKYLNNENSEFLEFDQQHRKLFNQLKMRLNNINNIRAQEIALYSDTLKIAGRVDCVADYKGTLSIIDFKTSNNNKDKDMVEDYFLQCTCYALMYEEMYDVFIEDIVVIIAVERGIMPLVFKRKIDPYVKPLVKRINTFYRKGK